MPENPIKASESSPAVTSAMGVPLIPLGTWLSSICSRKPEKMMRANPNPRAVAIAYTTLSTRLKSFWMTNMATPNTAQLVVIKGRNIPKA